MGATAGARAPRGRRGSAAGAGDPARALRDPQRPVRGGRRRRPRRVRRHLRPDRRLPARAAAGHGGGDRPDHRRLGRLRALLHDDPGAGLRAGAARPGRSAAEAQPSRRRRGAAAAGRACRSSRSRSWPPRPGSRCWPPRLADAGAVVAVRSRVATLATRARRAGREVWGIGLGLALVLAIGAHRARRCIGAVEVGGRRPAGACAPRCSSSRRPGCARSPARPGCARPRAARCSACAASRRRAEAARITERLESDRRLLPAARAFLAELGGRPAAAAARWPTR